jgi:hypothetical protein
MKSHARLPFTLAVIGRNKREIIVVYKRIDVSLEGEIYGMEWAEWRMIFQYTLELYVNSSK